MKPTARILYFVAIDVPANAAWVDASDYSKSTLAQRYPEKPEFNPLVG